MWPLSTAALWDVAAYASVPSEDERGDINAPSDRQTDRETSSPGPSQDSNALPAPPVAVQGFFYVAMPRQQSLWADLARACDCCRGV